MAKRVLVIDDDAKTRDLVAAFLGGAGYEVRGAEDGAAGLRLAAAEPPDVVILDLQMPGMDGYKVCQVLRRGLRTKRIPIVMLTASDDPHLNREAYAAGAQACVPKPFRQEGLIAAIEVAVSGMPHEKPNLSDPPAQ
ncbi:MAG: response regulator [candidate division NC10 bacterium]